MASDKVNEDSIKQESLRRAIETGTHGINTLKNAKHDDSATISNLNSLVSTATTKLNNALKDM